MKSELKSLAFAFKARDIELYLDPEQNDCIFINRLVCSNCNWYFHTSLLECYFCSEKNYYVFTCTTCQNLTSITGNGKRLCNTCNTATKQYLCKNPDCLSNDNNFSTTLNSIQGFKGVFERKGGWNVSCVFCMGCGSPKNEYKSFRVFLYEKEPFDDSNYQNFKNDNYEIDDLIILKRHGSNHIEYDYEIVGKQHRPGIFDKIGKDGLDEIVDEVLQT